MTTTHYVIIVALIVLAVVYMASARSVEKFHDYLDPVLALNHPHDVVTDPYLAHTHPHSHTITREVPIAPVLPRYATETQVYTHTHPHSHHSSYPHVTPGLYAGAYDGVVHTHPYVHSTSVYPLRHTGRCESYLNHPLLY